MVIAALFALLLCALGGASGSPPQGWKTCGNLIAAYNRTACPATQSCTKQQWVPSDGAWGCCPFPNGVSCGGYTCCPQGTVCHNHGTYDVRGPYGVVSICVPHNVSTPVSTPVAPGLRVSGDGGLHLDQSVSNEWTRANATVGDQVCKTGPPLPLSKTQPNVLIIGDSVSIGYTPWVAAAIADRAFVQHSPWGGDGGAEEAQYGLRCLDNLIRAPDGTPLSPDILMFNWGLHNSLSGNCTYPTALPPVTPYPVTNSTPCVFKPHCSLDRGTRAKGAASSKEECCTLCQSTKGCAAGVYDSGSCYFKSAQAVYEGCSNTTKDVVACINPLVPPTPPECDPGQSGPPDQYAPYLQQIVDKLKSTPALAKTRLLFAITSPDMCNAPINDLQVQLNSQAKAIMEKAGIPMVDLYSAVTGECGPVPQQSCFNASQCFCPHCYGNGQLGYQWLTNTTIVPAIDKILGHL